MPDSTAEPLGRAELLEHLRRHGLLSDTRPSEQVLVTELSGGVSGVVQLVEDGPNRMVVKQALGRLKVAADWRAGRERTLTEGRALQIAAAITPESVPRVLDLDAESLVLVIEAAPASWQTLKDRLLVGQVDTGAITVIGETLARWHNATSEDVGPAAALDSAQGFREQRTDPFHRVVMDCHPDLAPAVQSCIDELEQEQTCLVHGDFSPKNILVGTDGLWIVDFEVAHLGAPVFDLAFFLTHLLLKAAHRPQDRDALESASVELLAAYGRGAYERLQPDHTRLWLHVGCLLLARVDGKSPAAYLDVDARRVVRGLGRSLLTRSAGNPAEVWTRLAR